VSRVKEQKWPLKAYDDRIDPVGACVGMKGSRIHGIVRELKNENIDVINLHIKHQLLDPTFINSC
jgi:transcription termination/antitermination protein NusA